MLKSSGLRSVCVRACVCVACTRLCVRNSNSKCSAVSLSNSVSPGILVTPVTFDYSPRRFVLEVLQGEKTKSLSPSLLGVTFQEE